MVQRGLENLLKNKSAHEVTEEDGNEVAVKLRRLQRKDPGRLPRYLEHFMLQEDVDNYRETI